MKEGETTDTIHVTMNQNRNVRRKHHLVTLCGKVMHACMRERKIERDREK